MKQQKKAEKTTQHSPLEGTLNATGLYFVDPMGSYTGRPLDPEEEPVQDADDL